MCQWIKRAGAILGVACALGFGSAPAQTDGAVLSRRAGASDYAASLRNRIAWASFPLRIYFERDRNYRPERQARALKGLARWTAASKGIVRYQVTGAEEDADVVVRFDPSSNDGYTTTHFTNGEITLAEVRVGVKRGSGPDMEAIAAHEFGHVLGIDGHSGDRRDLMYPIHRMGASYRISARDLNTLARIYPQIRERVVSSSSR